MSELPPELKHQLFSSIRREPSPTRAEGRARRGWWLLVGLAVLVATASKNGLPPASRERPYLYLVAFGVSCVAVALFATLWLLSTASRPKRSLQGLVLAIPLLLATAAVGTAGLAAVTQQPGWHGHTMCFSVYAVAGSLMLAIGLLGVRPLDPVAPTMTGAAFGASVGAWVTIAVSVQCPTAAPAHVVLSHVAPILLLSAIGAALGGRILARRRRA